MNKPLGKLWDHFWLVQRMARATGTDLDAARDEGRLSEDEWSQMVTRCRGCTQTCACRDFLDQAELDGEIRDAALPGCENSLVFPKL